MIMIATSVMTFSIAARIEQVEVTYAGQAFKLGRYPIHFHLNGTYKSEDEIIISLHTRVEAISQTICDARPS